MIIAIIVCKLLIFSTLKLQQFSLITKFLDTYISSNSRYIASSIKVKKMETTSELLAGTQKFVLHDGGSLPPSIKDEDDLADKAWSKENNDLWDNDEW